MTSSKLASPGSSTSSRRLDLEEAYRLAVERFLRTDPGLLDWSEAFRFEEGEPLDFDAFPFQRELYDLFGAKDVPTVDVMKSGQCGISAAAVSLTLYAGDRWGANVLYVLPGAQDAYDFSDSRVAPAIEASPYLAMQFAEGTSNKGLKRIGNAWIYFRGSVSEKKALSIPADVLVLDEYDRLDQRNIPKFEKRLGSPKSLRLRRRFSNPSFPEAGIHRKYLDSDQRVWLVRCRCRHEAEVTYEQEETSHFVDEERELRVCGKCKRPLPPETIATGRWVARRRRRPPGFHISKLIVPGQDMAELVEGHNAGDEDTLSAHYNFDLGLPYAPKGGSLSEETIHACRRNYTPTDVYTGPDWVTAGVDIGRVIHVRISRWPAKFGGRAVPAFIGEIRSFEELAQLWDRFGVNLGVVDIYPEERKAKEFADAFRGRVLLNRWASEGQADNIVVDDDHRILKTRRTWACDQTIAAFEQQRRLLPKNLPRGYVPQVTAVFRVVEEKLNGGLVARYMSMRPDDHFFFAETYDLIARIARGGPPAEGAGPPPETLRQQRRRKR
jgi:hypothetical protein